MQLYLLLILESIELFRGRFNGSSNRLLHRAAALTMVAPVLNAWTIWTILGAVSGFDPRHPLPPPGGTVVVAAVAPFPLLIAALASNPQGTRHREIAQQLGLSPERILGRGVAYFLTSLGFFLFAVVFSKMWAALSLGRG